MKTIIIEVMGGCVVDVHNLPEGYTYDIDDHDLMEEGEPPYKEFSNVYLKEREEKEAKREAKQAKRKAKEEEKNAEQTQKT